LPRRRRVTERKPSSLAAAFVGALLGIVVAAMAKGALIGWDQTDAGWGWLSVPVGLISGPLLLFADMLALVGPPGATLIVLPWCAIGAAIGAIAGLLSNKDQ